MICDDSSFFATFNNLCHHLFLFSSTILCALVTFHHLHYLYFSRLMMLNTFPCDPRALVCACIFFVWHTSSNFSCSEVIVSFIFLILNYAQYWVDCIFRTNIFYLKQVWKYFIFACHLHISRFRCLLFCTSIYRQSHQSLSVQDSSVFCLTRRSHNFLPLGQFPSQFPKGPCHSWTLLSPLSHQAQTVEVDAHICIGLFIKNLNWST